MSAMSFSNRVKFLTILFICAAFVYGNKVSAQSLFDELIVEGETVSVPSDTQGEWWCSPG